MSLDERKERRRRQRTIRKKLANKYGDNEKLKSSSSDEDQWEDFYKQEDENDDNLSFVSRKRKYYHNPSTTSIEEEVWEEEENENSNGYSTNISTSDVIPSRRSNDPILYFHNIKNGATHVTTINGLPPEILIKIFSYLSPESSRTSRKVCWYWRSLLMSFLKSYKINEDTLSQHAFDHNWHRNTRTFRDRRTEIIKHHFSILSRFGNLQSLDCSDCFLITDDLVKEISEIKTIRYLNLTCCFKVTDVGVAHVIKSYRSKLYELKLGGLDKLTYKAFLSARRCKNLKELNLNGCRNITNEILPYLPKTRLRRLNLDGTRVGDFDIPKDAESKKIFESFKDFRRLCHLSVGNPFSGKIIFSYLPETLRSLYVTSAPHFDFKLFSKKIMGADRGNFMANLTSLQIAGNIDVTSKDLACLGSLPLKFLDVNWCKQLDDELVENYLPVTLCSLIATSTRIQFMSCNWKRFGNLRELWIDHGEKDLPELQNSMRRLNGTNLMTWRRRKGTV